MNETMGMRPTFRAIELTYIAIGAVLIAICSWLSIPTVVPFTMQTFAVFFVLTLLGGRCGTMAIIVYIILGAIGVPVFAEFTSGIGIILGTTGGYIVGFIVTGLVYWMAVGHLGKKLWVEVAALVLGHLLCYAFGTAWFLLVYARTSGAIGLTTALAWCVFPFIIPDLLKLALALTLAGRIPESLKLK